jgi:hypothetical protein
VGVDRVDGAVEFRGEEVVHHLSTDGAAPARCPDHRHRSGLEHAAHGSHRGAALALLEALHRLRSQRGRQLEADRVRRGVHVDGKAALAEDLDHPVIGGHHLGGEGRDPVALGDPCEVGEEDRRDPVTLVRLGDEERDLGAVAGLPRVGGVGDHLGRLAGLRDERIAILVVDIDRPRGHPVEVRRAEEAEHDRLGRDAVEERPDRGSVIGADRADSDRRSVPEDDVDDAVVRVRRGLRGRRLHVFMVRRGRGTRSVFSHCRPAHYQRRRRARTKVRWR